VLAQHTESDAQTLLAGETVLTPSAGQPGIEDHLHARLDILHRVADGFHHTRAIGAADVGQTDRHPGHAAEDIEIEVVESRGLQPYANLTDPGLGFRPVTVEQIVGASMLVEVQSFLAHLPRRVL
jgi:hypothetical protein